MDVQYLNAKQVSISGPPWNQPQSFLITKYPGKLGLLNCSSELNKIERGKKNTEESPLRASQGASSFQHPYITCIRYAINPLLKVAHVNLTQ